MQEDLLRVEKWSVLYIGTLVWMPLYFLPFDIALVIERYGLSEERSGWLASGQLLLLSLTTLFASRYAGALNKRRCSLFACAIGLGATVLIATSTDLVLLVAAKLIVGVSIGALVACVYGLAPHLKNPEKVFAAIAVTMGLLYAFILYLIPLLTEELGRNAVTWIEVIMLVSGVGLSSRMPVAIQLPVNSGKQVAVRPRLPAGSMWMLFGIFALFVSQTSALGFAVNGSHWLHIPDSQLGTALTVAALAQLPVGLLVGRLGHKAGYLKPICVGLLVLVASALGMYCTDSKYAFLLATSVLNAGATLSNPFMVAHLARIDESGRSAALAGFATNFGCAVGPALAGIVLGEGGLRSVGWMCVALLLASMAFASFSLRRSATNKHLAHSLAHSSRN